MKPKMITKFILLLFLTNPVTYVASANNLLNLNHVLGSVQNDSPIKNGTFMVYKDNFGISISEPQNVNKLCARSLYYLRALSMGILKDAVALNPGSDNAAFNFKSDDDLANFLGKGTTLKFPKDQWISLIWQ